MRIGICSFSFHQSLWDGTQDMFGYIKDCKALGCTQLDPWNFHLAPLLARDDEVRTNPDAPLIADFEEEYIQKVIDAAAEVGLPYGCVAADGAHIYEEDIAKREGNRRVAYRWIDIAGKLDAEQIRIDACGPGPKDIPDPVFQIMVDGYKDIIARADDLGIRMIMENHMGPIQYPDNVLRVLDALDGKLGLLLDTGNFAKGHREEGWRRCAHLAEALHVKTHNLDEDSVALEMVFRLLVESGYDACWGVESMVKGVSEYEGARLTIALIRRLVAKFQAEQT